MNNLKKKTSSPYRDRIDYITVATLYCWHLWISKAATAMDIHTSRIIRAFVSFVLPKRYVYKCYRNQINNRKYRDLLLRDLENGQNIRIAKNMVYQTCSGYLIFPWAVASGFISSLIGWEKVFDWHDGLCVKIIVISGAILFCIGLFKLTKAIQDPKTYLSFFKKVKKKDNDWLKKWKRNTILLYLGGIVSAVLGIILFFNAF